MKNSKRYLAMFIACMTLGTSVGFADGGSLDIHLDNQNPTLSTESNDNSAYGMICICGGNMTPISSSSGWDATGSTKKCSTTSHSHYGDYKWMAVQERRTVTTKYKCGKCGVAGRPSTKTEYRWTCKQLS